MDSILLLFSTLFATFHFAQRFYRCRSGCNAYNIFLREMALLQLTQVHKHKARAQINLQMLTMLTELGALL